MILMKSVIGPPYIPKHSNLQQVYKIHPFHFFHVGKVVLPKFPIHNFIKECKGGNVNAYALFLRDHTYYHDEILRENKDKFYHSNLQKNLMVELRILAQRLTSHYKRIGRTSDFVELRISLAIRFYTLVNEYKNLYHCGLTTSSLDDEIYAKLERVVNSAFDFDEFLTDMDFWFDYFDNLPIKESTFDQQWIDEYIYNLYGFDRFNEDREFPRSWFSSYADRFHN